MATKKEIKKFIKSQKSLHLYPKVQKAFTDVFYNMPNKDYKKVTKNLYLMVLHEGAFGQVMHFPKSKGKFKILQLSIAWNAPLSVLRYIIAHELGHAMQKRNWIKRDKNKLEINADEYVKKWGFIKTKIISEWMNKQ